MAASGPRTPRTRPTRGSSIRPVYETFEPMSEMKEKEEAYFLHIYLPGFTKEKIKINFMRSFRVVRVVGERPLGGNRISNFEQTYPVPENCEVEKLQGKYELGTLIITMPKKSISQVSPKTRVETTPRIGPTPLISPSKKPMPDQPNPKEVAKEAMPPKSPITRMQRGEKSNGDKTRPQHVQEETMLKPTTFASTPTKEIGKPQKGQEEIEPKPTSTMGFGKQIEDKSEEANKQNDISSYIENFRKKLHESVTLKEDKEDGKTHETGKLDPKYIDHKMVLKEKEIKTRSKEIVSFTPKAPEKGKETNTIDKGKSKEEDEIYTIGKGIKEVVASASEVVTKIGEGKLNDEEKPLVANMGAAILVIVALGAYVTYKFTSSTKA